MCSASLAGKSFEKWPRWFVLSSSLIVSIVKYSSPNSGTTFPADNLWEVGPIFQRHQVNFDRGFSVLFLFKMDVIFARVVPAVLEVEHFFCYDMRDSHSRLKRQDHVRPDIKKYQSTTHRLVRPSDLAIFSCSWKIMTLRFFIAAMRTSSSSER